MSSRGVRGEFAGSPPKNLPQHLLAIHLVNFSWDLPDSLPGRLREDRVRGERGHINRSPPTQNLQARLVCSVQ
ncbi:MAG: hypothetical protein ACI8PT_001214 [Gammaproteobacteria bacterium]|jgi:hypothetical protein